MNRVQKRFLMTVGKTICKGLAIITIYVFVSMCLIGLLYFFNIPLDPAIGIGAGAPILIFFIGYILYDTYKDIKYEVEREDRRLINQLKSDYYN